MFNIKRLVFSLLMGISLGATACFDVNPGQIIMPHRITIVGTSGSIVEVQHQQSPGFSASDWLSQFTPPAEDERLTKIVPTAVIRTATPFTLNISFSGFLSSQGEQADEEVTRATIFYYAKGGGWTILRDIKNPGFVVIDDEKPRPLFGKNTIPNQLGYTAGEYIPVVVYFENSAGQSSFNLNTFLSYRRYLGAPNFTSGVQVLAIVVSGNTRPQ